ncbi:S8 family serine peptidase [Stieleria magnilauensis]|uniref:Thermophilic serine proteinase n=1 Tax=Stieleria magnilauensis TaxID=2527963 RepID=A0ABX5XSA1_9BACT|nr:Thermophilic serine proteinase precursor [Planctomycetes bacterium TBK1r]
MTRPIQIRSRSSIRSSSRRHHRAVAGRPLRLEALERRCLLAAQLSVDTPSDRDGDSPGAVWTAFDDNDAPQRDAPQSDVGEILWDGNVAKVVQGQWIVHLDRPAAPPDSDGQSTDPSADSRSHNPFDLYDTRGASDLARRLLARRNPIRRIAQTDNTDQWVYAFEDVIMTRAMLDAFSQIPEVRSVEPDYAVELDLTPNDPSFHSLWGLNNGSDVDIDAPEAWELTTGSGSLVVGVIDTGVDYTHPDLRNNMWVNPIECPAGNGTCVEDGIDNDNNGYIDDIYGWDFYNDDNDPFDDHSHGTHVAGTIAAVGNNAEGVVGVNWNAKIMALKFIGRGGTGRTSGAVEAIQYANMMKRDYGVDIQLTNNSWGGGSYSQSLDDAIEANRSQGMLFVAAAGNDSEDNDTTPHYPSSYDHDNIVAVASITSSGSLSSFSNTGPTTVDVGAPGSNIYSTVPGGQYGRKSGTSMASPHVAGVAALAWSTDKNASYTKVRDAVLGGSVALPSLAGQTVTGGLVNALAAVERMGFFATAAFPTESQLLDVAPTQFTIDFSDAVNLASVNASDLRVNSIPADSFSFVDNDTVEFHFSSTPVTTEGAQTLSITAGTVAQASSGAGVAGLDNTFYFDPTPLRVASTTPDAGGLLSVSAPALTIDFTEPFSPGSLTHQDIVLSDGRVDGYTILDNDTVRFTFAELHNESNLSVSIAPGAITDSDGFPIEGFSRTYVLDLSSIDLADRFKTVGAPGVGIQAATVPGLFHDAGDSDEYSFEMEAGQIAGIRVTPRAGTPPNASHANLRVIDPSGSQVVLASAAPGEPTLLSSFRAANAGTYRLSVENAASTAGQYELEVRVGSAIETGDSAASGAGGNDSLANAESIESAWVAGPSHDQVTVSGSLDGGLTSDWYRLSPPGGSQVSFLLQLPEESEASLSLHRSDGSTVATGVRDGDALQIDAEQYTVGQDWFVQINGVGPADYVLSAIVDASFEQDQSGADRNGSVVNAQAFGSTDRIIGHVGGTGSSGPGIGIQSQAIDSSPVTELISLDSAPEGDQIRDVIYTPDGLHYLIAHPYSHNVLVYESSTGNVVADIATGRAVDVEVTPDGAYALTANTDSGTVSVINLANFTKVADIPLSASWPYRVHVTSDSGQAIVASGDDKFAVISLATMQETRAFSVPGHGQISWQTGFESERLLRRYSDFVISGDDLKIAIPVLIDGDGSVDIYQLSTGNRLASIAVPNGRPTLAINSDRSKVFATSRNGVTDSTITDIDLSTNVKLRDIAGPDLWDDDTLLTPDDQYLVAGGFNALVFIDLADGSVSSSIDQGSTKAFALTHDGQFILSRQVIDVATQTKVGNLPTFLWHELVATSPTELKGIQASTFADEDYTVIDLSGSTPSVLADRTAGAADEGDTVMGMQLSADQTIAVTANLDSNNLSVIDLVTNTVTRYIDLGFEPNSLAITPDATYAVAASSYESNNPVAFVNLVTGAVEATLPVSTRPRDVAISSDGAKAYAVSTGSNDSDAIHFFDVNGAATQATSVLPVGNTANGTTSSFTRLTLSPDGSILAVPVSRDGELVLVDTAGETEIARVRAGSFPTEALFSPDGKVVYVQSENGGSVTSVLIDGANTSIRGTANGLERNVAMTLDSSGDYLYVAGRDTSAMAVLYVVDASSMDLVKTIDLGVQGSPSRLVRVDDSIQVVISPWGSTDVPNGLPQDVLVRVFADGPNSSLIDQTTLGGQSRLIRHSDSLRKTVVALHDVDALQLVDYSGVDYGDEDYFRFLPQVGDEVTIHLQVPWTEPGLIDNPLDLGFEVLGPGGSSLGTILLDANVEDQFRFTATSDASHTVRVFARNFTSGEYLIDLSGVTEADTGMDFGDAPAPYRVLDSQGGAKHVATGPRLGARRDGEADGVPSAQADADDLAGEDDEDGVTFENLQAGSNTASIVVDAQNISGQAFIDAWIDFDHDGVWAGAFERIADSVPVTQGIHTIEFMVPPSAAGSDTYARVRISSTGQLAPGGEASDGEVEDYRVAILPPAASSTDFTREIIFEDANVRGSRLAAVDLDGDGDTDVVFPDGPFSNLVWLENDGTGQFTSRQISSGLSATRVAVGDIDGDGHVDIVAASPFSNKEVAWFRNDGAQNFQEMTIASGITQVEQLVLADSDQDGDLDVYLMTYRSDATVLHFENQGGVFVAQTLLTNVSAANMEVIDVDRDGDLDIVAGDDGLSWFENTATGFNQVVLDAGFYSQVHAVDLDGDHDIDIVASEGSVLRLFLNDDNQAFSQVVIGNVFAPRAIRSGDLDGDGDTDLAFASQGGSPTAPHTHLWLENQGNQQFVRHLLAEKPLGGSDLILVDFDGDADLDIASDRYPNGMHWFENINGIAPQLLAQTPAAGTAMVDPSANLALTFDGDVSKGAGDIRIVLASDDSVLATIDVSSPSVTINGNVVTIDPPQDLPINAAVYALVEPRVFRDGDGDAFQGITDERWTFETADTGVDFGDAPDTASGVGPGDYQSVAADGGPSNILTPGLYLGYFADGDDGTNQNAVATADDRDAARDDEDGVMSPWDLILTTGVAPTISVVATNLTAQSAELVGWIDYNQNGQFEPSESAQAVVGIGTLRTPITLTFPAVPSSLQSSTVLRLRYGHDVSSVGPVGTGTAGETEDHLVSVLQPGLGSGANTVEIADLVGGGPDLSPNDAFGSSVAAIGDVDGDGIHDIAVGAMQDDGFQSDAGAVYVLLLNADGSVKTLQKILPDGAGTAFYRNNRFGIGVAPAGDIDHDGVPDLAVLSLSHGGSGTSSLSIVLLNADGSVKDHDDPRLYLNFESISVEKLAAIGDLNGDGLPDFAVSDGDLSVTGSRIGGVHIVWGTVNGSGLRSQLITNTIGNGPAYTPADRFGSSVTAIGDIDGDGIIDLAVGAEGDSTSHASGGAVYVLRMNMDGTVKTHHKISELDLQSPVLKDSSNFGSSIAAIGDRDGDGVNDLLVGAARHSFSGAANVGAAFVVFLNSDGTVKGYTAIGDEAGHPEFATLESLAAIGDINGDGQMDLAFGNRRAGADNEGSVSLMFLDAIAAPTDILLSVDSVVESVDTSPMDVLLGTLQTLDLSPNDTHVYELVPGEGDRHNAMFRVVGAELYLRQHALIDYTLDDVLSLRIRVTDSTDQSLEKSFDIQVLNVPEVINVDVNEGQMSRSHLTSLRVTFDGILAEPNLASAFQIHNRDPLKADPQTSFSVDHSSGRTIVTFGFLSQLVDNGNYQMAINGSQVRSDVGIVMDDDFAFGESATDRFFRLYGDSDGDRDVDGQDYGRFGRSFLRGLGDPDYNPQFDSDLDGDVDGQDYGRFGLNFLKRLPF